jgi:flagellar biosynthesis/type III secretory pathway protein FliH
MKKTAKQKQKDRLYEEYMKGYRVGFEKGHEVGKAKGREGLQMQLQSLLNVPSAASSDDGMSYY